MTDIIQKTIGVCVDEEGVDVSSMMCKCRLVETQGPLLVIKCYADLFTYFQWATKSATYEEIDAMLAHKHLVGIGNSQSLKKVLNIQITLERAMIERLKYFFAMLEQVLHKYTAAERREMKDVPLKVVQNIDDIVLPYELHDRPVVVGPTPVIVPPRGKTRYEVWGDNIQKECGVYTDKVRGKKEMSLYTTEKRAKEYVANSAYTRLQDVLTILRQLNVKKVAFPGDGIGVGFIACDVLGIDSISGDLSPEMIAIGAKIGSCVTKEGAIATLGRAVKEGCDCFFISHVMPFAQGLIKLAAKYPLMIVVYEHETIYPGMSLLYEPVQGFRHLRISDMSRWRSGSLHLSLMDRKSAAVTNLVDYYCADDVYIITEMKVLSALAKMFSLVTNMKINITVLDRDIAEEVAKVCGFTLSTATEGVHLTMDDVIARIPGYTITRTVNLKYNFVGDVPVLYVDGKKELGSSYPAVVITRGVVRNAPVMRVFNGYKTCKGYLIRDATTISIVRDSSLSSVRLFEEGRTLYKAQPGPGSHVGEYLMGYDVSTQTYVQCEDYEVKAGWTDHIVPYEGKDIEERDLYPCSSHLFICKREGGELLFLTTKMCADNGGKDVVLLDFSASGHVRPGETFKQAIIREAQEEIPNVEYSSLQCVGSYYPDDKFFGRCNVYLALYVSGEPREGEWMNFARLYSLYGACKNRGKASKSLLRKSGIGGMKCDMYAWFAEGDKLWYKTATEAIEFALAYEGFNDSKSVEKQVVTVQISK